MAPRRLVRTAVQLVVLIVSAGFLVFFLDSRYRVLPNSIHSRLPQHHVDQVITDVSLSTCLKISLLSGCNMPREWTRINKDIYLEEKWLNHGFVHVKRKKEKELNDGELVVLDIKVSRRQPEAEHGEKWESRPGGIWIKRGKLTDNCVTAVDVLFGADAVEPRMGWEMRGALTSGHDARLTVRMGAPDHPKKPELRMRKGGKLKIVQISDLHLSTGVTTCRDVYPPEAAKGCESDPKTLEYLDKLLEEEKPDLAVLSGDIVNGETSPDAQSTIFKIADALAKRKIPYAAIFGNHDDEGSLNRAELMHIIEGLPYSVSEAGPQNLPGVGNYYLEIKAPKTEHSAITIYLVDSHAYSPNVKKYKGYDWIKQEQIDWFKETSEKLKEPHKHYALQHLDMAFIHIPLPEYRGVWTGKLYHGQRGEPNTAPNYNSHFRDALVEAGVKVVSAGHDHANSYCMLDNTGGKSNMWMCYAGASGYGGYSGYNGKPEARRIRFFEIDAPSGRITTWKRLDYNDQGKLDEQVIVDGGKVVERIMQ